MSTGALMRNHIARLWTGQTPLARVFWDYAMIYGTLLNLITTFASLAALALGAPGLVALAIFLLPLPYNIFVVVAVWRSAALYRGPARWAQLARIAVVAWAAIASVV